MKSLLPNQLGTASFSRPCESRLDVDHGATSTSVATEIVSRSIEQATSAERVKLILVSKEEEDTGYSETEVRGQR